MKKAVPVLLLALLAGCSLTNPVKPYKIDIQQGNVVTQDMVAKLRPGMTKSQVRFIMGTSLLTDVFHNDRWDYVYSYQKDGELTEQRHISLFFENDALVRVGGDVVAAPPPAPESAPVPGGAAVTPIPTGEGPQGAPLPASGEVAPVAKPTEQPAAPAETPKAEEEKGFFGRMLEKVGL